MRDTNETTAQVAPTDTPARDVIHQPVLPQLTVGDEKSPEFTNLQKAALSKPSALPTLPMEPEKVTVPNYVYVTGSRVNLRSGPGTNHKVLAGFDKGSKLILQSQNDGWSRVSGQRAGRPVVGWMSSKYLSADAPAPVTKVAAAPKRQVATPSSSEITRARKELIHQSISTYRGNCACPYHRDRANRKCGRRSAWSRPGGASPLCYESDVTRSRLVAYFSRQGKIMP